MGYTTYARGVIAIHPPIPWHRIKDSPFLPDGGNDELDVKFVLSQEERDTSEGVLTVIEATGVEQRYEDDPRNYNIVVHLQRLIDAFPDHEFLGRFECEGEEAGDLWRVEIEGRKAMKVKPRIVWPDGSETRPR